jgi:hypothetical protein
MQIEWSERGDRETHLSGDPQHSKAIFFTIQAVEISLLLYPP